MGDYKFEIKRELATLSSRDSISKKVTLTSWNDAPAKVDIRAWRTTSEGVKPGKGITLTDEESAILAEALTAYGAEAGNA